MAYQIERDGFFFRAVAADGTRSSLLTSASQAGRFIERRAGAEAHRVAAVAFLGQIA